jgi:ParB/RepB/Spo0J family partition protein
MKEIRKSSKSPIKGPSKSAAKRPLQGASSKNTSTNDKALHKIDQLLQFEGLVQEASEVVEATPEVREEAPSQKPPSRFERSLERASRGEAGPIKVENLYLDVECERKAVGSKLADYYRKLLAANPEAQPGRPLVNVKGSSDDDLEFQLLTLYELVIAAKECGRSIIQVSLVRISEEEAEGILKNNRVAEVAVEQQPIKPLTLSEIAELNGFFELNISDIERDQNIRYQININSQEFRNLKESIRTIGLQNPPVVEVRQSEAGAEPHLVCISGHRRLLALESLGFEKVVCALKKFQSSRHRTLAGLAENINREDLHFLDKAQGYGQLVGLGMSTAEIAVLLDGDLRTIGKYVRASQWDEAVKERVRKLGAKLTVRYLLNTMAAGERSPGELHGMLDRIEFPNQQAPAKDKPVKEVNYETKLGEFCDLMRLTQDQRGMIQKALKYLGVIK